MSRRAIILTFAIAAATYFGGFYGIEYLRTRKGGWEVTFQTDSSGAPLLNVTQRYLQISNVTAVFPDQRMVLSNLPVTVVFSKPITNVPFGRVIYLDTTFLPGSVVFGLFGHEIQLLPRVLIVDRKELPWRTGMVLQLPTAK